MLNQWHKDAVEQNARFRTELVQLSRLAVSGDTERLKIQLMRLIRMLRQENDGLAEALQQAAFGEPGALAEPARSATRREFSIAEPVPMDDDSKADILRVEDPPAIAHALVRNAALDRQIQQLVAERRALRRLSDAGLEAPSSVLFTGPPGVGKTETAREIAQLLKVPLLVLDLATVISSLLGKTGNNIKRAFAFARRMPCVLFLDEIDAVAKRRDDSGDVGELKRLVTVLLQEIDLWPSSNLLIAATNHAQLLDPAVVRRFDQAITFARPGRDELAQLGMAICANQDRFPTPWVELLAELSQGTSHSDFLRDLNRLRRAIVLSGRREGIQILKEVTIERSVDLPKEAKKRIATGLVAGAGISIREASRLTGLARDTVNSALQGAVST